MTVARLHSKASRAPARLRSKAKMTLSEACQHDVFLLKESNVPGQFSTFIDKGVLFQEGKVVALRFDYVKTPCVRYELAILVGLNPTASWSNRLITRPLKTNELWRGYAQKKRRGFVPHDYIMVYNKKRVMTCSIQSLVGRAEVFLSNHPDKDMLPNYSQTLSALFPDSDPAQLSLSSILAESAQIDPLFVILQLRWSQDKMLTLFQLMGMPQQKLTRTLKKTTKKFFGIIDRLKTKSPLMTTSTPRDRRTFFRQPTRALQKYAASVLKNLKQIVDNYQRHH